MDSKLLEKVILQTDLKYAPDFSVIKRLEEEGLSVVKLQEAMREAEQAEGIMLITDSAEAYLHYHKRIPVYVYLHEGVEAKAFPDAVYFIEGLDDIDSRFLEGIYRRLQGIPWLIGKKEGIIVREMIPEDAEELHELYSADEVWYTENLLSFGQSTEETREYIRSYCRNRYGIYGYGMWSVIEEKTGQLIGRVGFQLSDNEEETELGFLMKKEYRRKGIAYRAVLIALEYRKEFYPDLKVTCVIRKDNLPALSFIEKIMRNEKYEIRLQVI